MKHLPHNTIIPQLTLIRRGRERAVPRYISNYNRVSDVCMYEEEEEERRNMFI